MTAKEQNEKLANYIMENYPEYIIDGGAGDVAISIMQRLSAALSAALKAEAIRWSKSVVDDEDNDG